MSSVRKDRLSQQLQREIATIIHRELKDPRLGFVTITKVELSNDLSYAKVAFSCLGGAQQRAQAQDTLDHATGFIRSMLKKHLRLKIIPAIVFRYDETVVQAIDLAAKLDQLQTTRPPGLAPRQPP